MNAHIGVHLHEPSRIRLEMLWGRLLAASAILILAGIGIVTAWREAHPFGLQRFLFALLVTLGPAAAYAFGYFRSLPDVLGAESPAQPRSLPQRWSDFVRLTSAGAVIMTWICWGAIIAKHFRGMVLPFTQIPSMVNLFVLGMLTTRPGLCAIGALLAAALVALCVVASEEYLARTMEQTNTPAATGWRAGVRRAVGKCGELLGARLRAKPALVLGGALLVLSLFARMDLFGGYGFQVISGSQSWPTAEYTLEKPALTILSQAGRLVYAAAVAVGLLGLASVATRRLGDRLRRSPALAFLSMLVALFAVCDLAFGVARLDSLVPRPLNFAVLAIVWLLPMAMWMWRARGDGARWDRTRIAVMILYVSPVLAGLALVPLALILVPSYALFLLGAVLLAWGFAQSRWEMA